MTTMSDDGERACPLCAEEMDLTDQQLKPCKCGYEICVWCWHHIIEMAEKEDTEGRCPACRTPYDKERIAGTAGNCERVVAEQNAEKRQKPQKAKSKTSLEARKHLSSVRVIQRNLVYVIGLPSNLCDENLLERREYFGQYGRVLKVSISRPSGAAGQQASNNSTFSVYITYAREEEAVRCIQAVHNFALEGKPLRACFGTTKYCHAWLRNMNCSNPDCMYLHDIGSQEDSFTKDEIISAYTRSRVPQVASNNAQKRSGNVLPAPVDDIYNNGVSSGRHPVKNGPISNVGQSKVASNCSNGGKAAGLPPAASWGLRLSNCRQPLTVSATSQGILKQKLESANVSNVKPCSAWHDNVATSKLSEVGQLLNNDSRQRSMERTCSSNCHVPDEDNETSFDVCQTHITSAWDDDEFLLVTDSTKNHSKNVSVEVQSAGPVQQSLECSSVPVVSSRSSEIPLSFTSSPAAAAIDMAAGIINSKNSAVVMTDSDRGGFGSTPASLLSEFRAIEGFSSGLFSLNADGHLHADKVGVASSQSSDPMLHPVIESASMLSINPSLTIDADASGKTYIVNSKPRSQGQHLNANSNGDVVVADDHKHRLPDSTLPQMWSSCSSELPSTEDCYSKKNFWTSKLSAQAESTSFFGSQIKTSIANGHTKDELSSMSQGATESSDVNCYKEKANYVEIFDSAANIKKSATVDTGECGIISDILSLDFDPWDDSLSAANNFARLLGETGLQDGSFKQPNSWKSQSSKESRFSFARQDSEGYTREHAIQETGHARSLSSSSQDVYGDRFHNGLLTKGFGNSFCIGGPTSSDKHGLSDRILGASKSKIQAPPGFSVPNRAPPPGFSTQERYDQGYGAFSDHVVGDSPLCNQQQFYPSENTGDVELIDPAILAVGKGRLPLGVNNSGFNLASPFPTQFNSFESDPRLQLVMQQSISTQPDLRFSEHPGDRVLPLNDSYISSNLIAQNNGISSFGRMTFQHPRSLQMSTNQWDSWSDIRTANDLGLSENMRNDSFGLSNYFQGNEERKFHMTSPGNLYNRAFGM